MFGLFVDRFFFTNFDPSWTICRLYWLRMLSQFVQHMEVAYLPVVQPTPHDRNNPADYASRVRRIMALNLNVPETEHGLADVLLQDAALREQLPPSGSTCRRK